jgi:hypothetical protein
MPTRLRTLTRELGKTGIRHSVGYILEDFLVVLQGSSGRRIYRQMADNDPIVGSILHAITQIIREARWTAKPGEDTAECRKDADFLEDCINDMSTSWMDFITEILSMMIYGWSYFEQVFKHRKDGKVGWKKLAPRVQTSLERWEIDDAGGLKGMWQRPAPDYGLFYIPLKKSLLFRPGMHGDNPEGRSLLRTAYRSWYIKKNLEEFEAIGIERDLAGLPTITAPEGFKIDDTDDAVVEMVTWAKELITSVRRDEQEGIFLPGGWEIQLLASGGNRQFDTTQIINRYNKEIAVTVLAQFVMLGMERTGSFALAKEQTNMFYLSLEGWADGIASVFNRYAIPLLFALNGGTGNRPLPYVAHSPIGVHSLRDLGSYIAALSGAELLVKDEDLKAVLKRYARLTEYSEKRK